MLVCPIGRTYPDMYLLMATPPAAGPSNAWQTLTCADEHTHCVRHCKCSSKQFFYVARTVKAKLGGWRGCPPAFVTSGTSLSGRHLATGVKLRPGRNTALILLVSISAALWLWLTTGTGYGLPYGCCGGTCYFHCCLTLRSGCPSRCRLSSCLGEWYMVCSGSRCCVFFC